MNNELLACFSDTVEAIHAAALQPQVWPQALARIAALHGAHRALVLTPTTHPDNGGFVLAHAIPESFLQEWAARFIAHDIWTTQARRLGLVRDGNVVLGEEMVPDAELVQSVFYREFLARLDIRRLCSGIVFSGQLPGLPLTSCSVFRGAADKAFNATNRQLHTLVTSHLSQALGTALRLRDGEFRLATSLQALDRLHSSVLLIGQRGNVLFANRNALALLARGCGLALRAGNPLADALGWLQTINAHEQAALDTELRAALANDALRAAPFAHGLALQRPGALGALVVHVVPLAERSSETWCRWLQPGAIVFITDPQAVPVLDALLLRRIYRISAAECRVAQELLRGQTLQETARHLHLGDNTVKTHLKQLFEKTSTSRQQQLIRLLLGLAEQYG